ncbi:MFS general substrate transporter [Mycena amicta]|nr:MFS general substrate transporter [Mycena amicta]
MRGKRVQKHLSIGVLGKYDCLMASQTQLAACGDTWACPSPSPSQLPHGCLEASISTDTSLTVHHLDSTRIHRASSFVSNQCLLKTVKFEDLRRLPCLSRVYALPAYQHSSQSRPTFTERRANSRSLTQGSLTELDQVVLGVHAVPPLSDPLAGIPQQLQLLALCGTLFLSGWNDGSIGPLIPKIQEYYGLSYTIVSLIFVFKCTGHLVGAIGNIWLTQRYGFGKNSFFQIIGNSLQCAALVLPFPVFVLGNFLTGIGLATQNSQTNGYVVSLTSPETKMGIVQASYGAGALVSPLVSTQFAQLTHGRWSYNYIITVGLSLLNGLHLYAVFRGRRQEDCLARIGQIEQEFRVDSSSGNKQSHMRQMLSVKAVHLLAIFLFVYVGTEVTIGGWIVSFMITVRHGGASSGYISAGFWGGLMLGRLLLLPVNKLIGEVRAIYVYTASAIGLELLIWLIPSFLTSAIAVSLVGLCLGPIFPIGMTHAARILPPHLLTASIAWVSGISISGAAVLPFITGAIAGKRGIGSLEPFAVAMLVLMGLLWVTVPRRRI